MKRKQRKFRLGRKICCAILLCVFLMNCLSISVKAVSVYTIEPSYSRDYNFTVTVDGLDVTLDKQYHEIINWNDKYVAHANRGDVFFIGVTWPEGTDAGKGVIVVYSSGKEEVAKDEYADEIKYGIGEYKVYSFESKWTEVTSFSDNGIELKITAPMEAEVDNVNFIVSRQTSGYLATFSISIQLDGEGIADPNEQSVTTEAEETSGENSGEYIDSDTVDGPSGKPGEKPSSHSSDDDETSTKILISVGGAIAAIGVIGASSSSEKGNKKNKKKRYKMYVQKDFGNIIRKGAKPVKIRARIAEIDEEGKERDRNDLTAKISAYSEGLILHGAAQVGRYMEMTVSAAQDFDGQSGSITFRYVGSGGSFSNKVIFRVLGDPYLVFPDLSEDGSTWLLDYCLNKISMVAGMGGQDSVRFLIQDAAEEPRKITFGDTEGFSVTSAKDGAKAYTYYAHVTNHTEKMEKQSNIFAREREREILINVEFPDGSMIKDSFFVMLYPDGLSVEATNPRNIVEGRLQINTEPDPNAAPGYAPIKPVGFKVKACYVDADGKAVILENPTLHFGNLEDDGKYVNTFKEQFQYKIERTGSVGFDFAPKSTLPTIIRPYEVKLPLKFSKEVSLDGEMPISFLGLKPLPPSQIEKDEAIEKLKETIRAFGLSSGDKQLMKMVRNARNHSAAEIEYTRRQVLIAAKKFYENESTEYTQIANVFDRYVVVAGGLVTAGDYAIEVILTKCLGGVGKTTAKFINPLKNMLATTIGEYIANGTEFSEEEFWKAYRSGIYDAIEQALSDVKPNSDKIAYVPAAYLLLMFVKHYYDGKGKEKGDVYRSLIAAFYDLKFAQLKEWIGDYVSKGAGKLWDKVQEWFTNIFKLRFVSSMVKTMESAGMKAFTDQVRAAYKSGGTLTRDQYEKAKRARVFAEIMQGEQASAMISRGASQFGEKGKEITKIGLAQVVNYFIGGKNNGEEGYGASPEDVIQEFLFDKLSDNLEKGIEYTEDFFEKALPGIYISGSVMTVTCFDESYEVNLAEMAQKIIDAMFDYCFSWMDDFWKTVMPDMNSLPDKRDEMSDDTSLLDQQQARLDNAKS